MFKLFKEQLSNQSPLKILVRSYRPRRALLYVPGDDPKKLNKGLNLDVDCIAMDCEDGVAMNKKEQARVTIASVLDKGKPQKDRDYDLGVRVNPVHSPLFKEDIAYALKAKHLPDTILLPKVETAEHLKMFSDEAERLIQGRGVINLIIYIETAIAFINLVAICEAATHLSKHIAPTSVVFGSDDFCASIGATRTENSIEILYARQKLVLVAKAFNLQPIDMVYIKYKDLDGLKRQSEEGARMGYTGKQVIHPSQVPIVQQAFLPDQSRIAWASGLLEAFEQHQKTGKGAFTYGGSMIDMPTMKQAKNIINLMNSIKKN